MARTASPWYWEERAGWYVTRDGQRHFLGEHPKAAKKPRKRDGTWNVPKEIADAFHKLMSSPVKKAIPQSVVAVLDDFLVWTEENRAERTYMRYKDFCQSFCDKYGRLRISDLTTAHVTAWLKTHRKWNSTTKRSAITALQRGFNWAVTNRGLDRNPIRGMEKPEAKRRTIVATPEEFETVLAQVTDQPFRDLLIVSFDSGARPQEVKNLEARHIDLDKCRAVMPAEEAKGGIPRAIYFPTDRSMEIIGRLAKARRTGPLFLNNRGNQWTGFAVKNRFEDIEEKVGKRFTHYSLRHSFVTRKLLAGVDSHVVASLAGHKDVGMIHRVYSHVADDHKFMLDAAKKDVKPAGGEAARGG